MFTQTDKRWSNDDMGMAGDKIWRWGCLISSIANIITKCIGVEVTPGQLNAQLRANGGYMGSKYPGEESDLNWSYLQSLYGFKCNLNISKDDFSVVPNKGYIAMVIHPLTGKGHFINVMNKNVGNWDCFDVEDGRTKIYMDNQIIKIIEIEV
jgi:hypothetical protein